MLLDLFINNSVIDYQKEIASIRCLRNPLFIF